MKIARTIIVYPQKCNSLMAVLVVIVTIEMIKSSLTYSNLFAFG